MASIAILNFTYQGGDLSKSDLTIAAEFGKGNRYFYR